MLEHAAAVSSSRQLPNLERTDTFVAYDLAHGTREGTFTRVVIQGTGRRDEVAFGDYHSLNVWARGRLATTRSQPLAPPEIVDLMRLTPIYMLRFDHEDVIQSIASKEVGGGTLRCIEFQTNAGARSESNEFCLDAANGTLVSEKVDNELIENSDFFSFAGSLIPGKIRYSRNGVLRMQISQTMTELTEVTPNVLEAPPDAKVMTGCRTFRRAFGESMPQPKAANGGGETDVVMRGIIGADGKVHEALVQSSDRPDLDSEALSLIQQWTFTPALCSGNPVQIEASFTLQFQGR